MVSVAQSTLYFHTSVESVFHFKGTQRGMGGWGQRGRRRKREGREKERATGRWLHFDLISIKQENIKVDSIKVWIFVPCGLRQVSVSLSSGRAGKSSPHPAGRVTDPGAPLISDSISSFQSHNSFCFFISFCVARGHKSSSPLPLRELQAESAPLPFISRCYEFRAVSYLLCFDITQIRLTNRNGKVPLSPLKIAPTSLN